MNENGHGDSHQSGTCSCCGDATAPSDYRPIEFNSKFRYYLLIPEDPGAMPTGTETILAATNDSRAARIMLNALNADGHPVSGWNNEIGGWFLTPEITEAFAQMMRESHPH